ncbi:thioredoxin family protein [Flavobacterium soli]|uniref:thioredoxin family protein n=1 Tax=Flavobacterium soli TaxID=344881 RepID=UPI0004058BE3|nr:thioredoxin family protein [Flavobacterium soli]
MKKLILLLFLATFSTAFSQNWEKNFTEAKAKAVIENKNILLVFSGSDWCAPCIKLDKNVWQSEAFSKASKENWIIYKADFPKKKSNQLSQELTNENKALAEKYNKAGNFPLVVLLDKNGKVLGMESFKNITADEYVQLLHSFEK